MNWQPTRLFLWIDNQVRNLMFHISLSIKENTRSAVLMGIKDGAWMYHCGYGAKYALKIAGIYWFKRGKK